ncbi:MAG TPA: serine hydrolase, partial [Negativicutes bacterium]|nr:serine hydrolase [Negativicutes bacterium]
MNDASLDIAARIAVVTKNEPGTFAIAVKDPATGFAWSIGSRPMRSASLIKLFIMVEIFEQIKSRRLKPTDLLIFTENDRVAGAGLLQELPSGTSHTVMELIELMITESDNIATNILIDRIGAAAINTRIKSLGCPDTVLMRRMMDFAAAEAGRENLTSVMDIINLLTQLYHTACVDSDADFAMCDIMGRQTDRCKIPLLLPPSVTCQHKTGELPGAEHDAGIIRTPRGSYILAIMSDDLPDPERGIQVAARISRTIYDWY